MQLLGRDDLALDEALKAGVAEAEGEDPISDSYKELFNDVVIAKDIVARLVEEWCGKECKIRPVGSFYTKLGFNVGRASRGESGSAGSDVDLAVVMETPDFLPERDAPAEIRSLMRHLTKRLPSREAGSEEVEGKLKHIHGELSKARPEPGFERAVVKHERERVRTLLRDYEWRVPAFTTSKRASWIASVFIERRTDGAEFLKVDLVFSSAGAVSSERVLKAYDALLGEKGSSALRQQAEEMLLVVKMLLQSNGLSGTAQGGVSGFLLAVLVLHFLRFNNGENDSALWFSAKGRHPLLEFLEYFGDLSRDDHAVFEASLGLVALHQQRCQSYFHVETDEANSLGFNGEPSSGVYKWTSVQNLFLKLAKLLRGGMTTAEKGLLGRKAGYDYEDQLETAAVEAATEDFLDELEKRTYEESNKAAKKQEQRVVPSRTKHDQESSEKAADVVMGGHQDHSDSDVAAIQDAFGSMRITRPTEKHGRAAADRARQLSAELQERARAWADQSRHMDKLKKLLGTLESGALPPLLRRICDGEKTENGRKAYQLLLAYVYIVLAESLTGGSASGFMVKSGKAHVPISTMDLVERKGTPPKEALEKMRDLIKNYKPETRSVFTTSGRQGKSEKSQNIASQSLALTEEDSQAGRSAENKRMPSLEEAVRFAADELIQVTEVVNTYNRTKGVDSFLIPVADKVAEITAAARPHLARFRQLGMIADEAVQLDFGEDARQRNPGLDGWVKKNASAMQELQQALEKLTFSSRSKSSLQRSLEAFVEKSRATSTSGFGDAVANGVLAQIGGERGREAFVRGFSRPGMERELLAKMTGEEAADALGPLSLKEQDGAAAHLGERPSKRQRRGRPLVMGVEVSLLPNEYLERELAEEEKVEARGVQEYPQGHLRMEEERRKKLREIMAAGGVVQDFRVQWPLVPGSQDFLCRLRFFKLLPEANTKDPVRLHRLDIVGPESEGRKKLLSIEIVPQGAWPWAD
eukprot:g1008.t1